MNGSSPDRATIRAALDVARQTLELVAATVNEIGDELAVSRALAHLAHQLLETAADDIEAVTGRPAHLTT